MDEERLRRPVFGTANLTVGASTVRNQVAFEVIEAARDALKAVNLRRFKIVAISRFRPLLDVQTEGSSKRRKR